MTNADFLTSYTVLTTVAIDFPLTYLGETGLPLGQLIVIPFRNKQIIGIITKTKKSDIYKGELKQISAVLPYRFDSAFINFIEHVANYTMIPIGQILKMCITPKLDAVLRDDDLPPLPSYKLDTLTLNHDQERAFHSCHAALDHFQPFALDGVTGAGKTELYFAVIQSVLKMGKKALVLFPEIALTEAIVNRFKETFGDYPLVWHSDVTPVKKRKLWKHVQIKGAAVILGARSALFLPIHDLGLIVIDEEHDSSYKQDEQGCYNARDMAIWRAKEENIPIILASATPSLETFANIKSKRFEHLTLGQRYGAAEMPTVHIIDKKEYPKDIISQPICDEIAARLIKREQTLLFLNRRGFSPILACFGCGHRFQCPGCHIDLTWHRNRQSIICHYCGFQTNQPSNCPTCQGTNLKDLGLGVEKVEEEANRLFPSARIVTVSSDTLATTKASNDLFNSIESGEIDIIIGTQVLAKGHHFPNLTLVGILDADRGLYQMDLRAAERAFQLLSQVGGRAGRMARQPGVVMLQTREPEHPLYVALKAYDRDAFYETELLERELLAMPPYYRLISITLSSLREDILQETCRQLARAIPQTEHIDVLGPAPSPMYRLRSRFRMRFLIKGDRKQNLQAFTKVWLSKIKLSPAIHIHIDVDPLNFL